MTRYTAYIRSLVTGYGLLVLNSVYSLALVPLALVHLGKETYGLWAVTLQIGIVAQTFEMAITVAFNRILMDYKDEKSSSGYRQTFFSLWLFFALFGVAVLILIATLSPFIIEWVSIPLKFHSEYQKVLMAYGCVIGASMIARPINVLLFIHQRNDILNQISFVATIISFFIIWTALSWGWGLWSFIVGSSLSFLFTIFCATAQVVKRRYIPAWKRGDSLSRTAFLHVLDYGKDRLVLNLGVTLLQSAPTFIITRTLGLDANAIWAVSSRVNYLCLQLISRIGDLSFPALVEMSVRGETTTLRKRYSHLVILSLGATAVCSTGIAVCNSQFVTLWTSGKIVCPPELSMMLAAWLLTQSLQRYLYLPVGIARDLKGLRMSYIFESLLAVGCTVALLNLDESLWTIPASFAFASALVTIPIFFRKSASVLKESVSEMTRPLMPVITRVLLPSAIISGLSLLLPVYGGALPFITRALFVVVITTALLFTIPEIRGVIYELVTRIKNWISLKRLPR